MRMLITNTVLDVAAFTDDFTFSTSESSDNFQCYHTTKTPTTVDWMESYALDQITQIILPKLEKDSTSSFKITELRSIESEYRSHSLANLI